MLHESALTSTEEVFPIFVYKTMITILIIHTHRGENTFITWCYFTVEYVLPTELLIRNNMPGGWGDSNMEQTGMQRIIEFAS